MSGPDGSCVTIEIARCAHYRVSPPELRIRRQHPPFGRDCLEVPVCLERRKLVAPKQLRPNWVVCQCAGRPARSRGCKSPTGKDLASRPGRE